MSVVLIVQPTKPTRSKRPFMLYINFVSSVTLILPLYISSYII